jgi:L-ribulokinase
MAIVAGVDFGTLSVRVAIFESEGGRLGSATAEYPLHLSKDDPDFATQSHEDHMRALVVAMQNALQAANVSGKDIASIALDTTGSSVIPVDENFAPLNDYYLWCDHRAWREAASITKAAGEQKLEALEWCGGVYSSEWGFSKLLHWLRNNPEKRSQFATALEHCDMLTAVLCNVKDVAEVPRSICAMGHKWMWNDSLGGLPSEEFLTSVDPLFAGVRQKLQGRYATSDKIAGGLCAEWAAKLELASDIPIPVGAFDAHWDAIGVGAKPGDVTNVVGTTTCIMAISETTKFIPGVCGVVQGSIDPQRTGVEAGLSATGDLFATIARRSRSTVKDLFMGLENYRPGETGLLRLTWDNGDRTILVNPELGGVTFGWNMTHTAQDEMFAAIEGCAFHNRIILERMRDYGVPINRVINAGGIAQKSTVLNQVYANVFNKPVLVPRSDVTSLGSSIFAFLAAGIFKSIEEAQAKFCPGYNVIEPDPSAVAVYEELYQIYRELYFSFGVANSKPASLGRVLPTIRRIAAAGRKAN